MCGILGFIGRPERMQEGRFTKALNTIFHRGPDDFLVSKTPISYDWEIWLGHRRLSVLDLRENARQPMFYAKDDDKYLIVFNGEIYNYKSLRQELRFEREANTDSDTEVLLRGLVEQGHSFLERLNGMWALAFFDYRQKKLLLSRDRLGKKPLYVYSNSEYIAFSSELKPFRELGLELTLDEESLALYHWLGYIPAQKTIYRQVSKFPAASYTEIDLSLSRHVMSEPRLFWDPLRAYGNSFSGNYHDAVDRFLELLDDAVLIRSSADVPVGVLLSGGIDSSLVVASLAVQKRCDVQVYTVAQTDIQLDESLVARDTCKKLELELEVLLLKTYDFERQLEIATQYYDEPFSDISQIPTLTISEAAKSKVTVILTGDGGDEVFLGYPYFSYPQRFWKYSRRMLMLPGLLPVVKRLLKSNLMRPLVGKLVKSIGLMPINLDEKLVRFSEILMSRTRDEIYDCILAVTPRRLLSFTDQSWLEGDSLMQMVQRWYPKYAWDVLKQRSVEEKVAALDLITFMRDCVLVKVDRGTMAYGIEARSPLLDWRIVEFGLSLPRDFKIRKGCYKAILRSALERRVAGQISNLPKRGFSVPFPTCLEPGINLGARWNSHIEKKWRKRYD